MAMSRRPKNWGKSNPILAIFATVLVVSGIVAAAYFSSHPANEPKNEPQSTQPETALATSTGSLLLINSDSVTVIAQGKTQRYSKQDFSRKFIISALPSEGSDSANGAKAYLNLKEGSGADAPLNQDLKTMARLGKPKTDGAPVIDLDQSGVTVSTLVLRDKAGKPLKDARLLGWLDGRTIAFTALASSTRAIYSISVDGVARLLAVLPEVTLNLDGRDGAVWYTTATQGEGLESQPRGPSELHRVSATGENRLLAAELNNVILEVLPYQDTGYAYVRDDGAAFFASNDGALKRDLGKRKPLAFTADGSIVLREGFDLVLFDLATGSAQKIGTVPEGKVTAFYVLRLDEMPKGQ